MEGNENMGNKMGRQKGRKRGEGKAETDRPNGRLREQEVGHIHTEPERWE